MLIELTPSLCAGQYQTKYPSVMAGLFGLMIAVKLGFAVVVFKVARHSAANLYKKEKSEV